MKKRLILRDLKDLNCSVFRNKDINIYVFFQKFYGFGATTSFRIIKLLGMPFYYKLKFINDEQIKLLYKLLKQKFYINYLLIKQKRLKKIKKLGTFFALRHLNNFPVHGQKTRTNANTRKKFNIE